MYDEKKRQINNVSLILRFKFLTIVLASWLSLVFALGILMLANSDKVIFGAKAAGLDLGGRPLNQAREMIKEKIVEFSRQKINFIAGENQIQFTPEEMGIVFETDKVLADIKELGRGPNFLLGINEQVAAFLFGKNLSLPFALDKDKFKIVSQKIFSIGQQPPQNAVLYFNKERNAFEIIEGKKGALANQEKFSQDLIINFGQLNNQDIVVSLTLEEPILKAKDLIVFKEEAEKIISQAPFFINFGEARWPIDKNELAGWLIVVPNSAPPPAAHLVLNEKEIKTLLASIASAINRPAVNAKLTPDQEEGKITVFSLGQTGQRLDIETSAKKINEGIMFGKKNIELVVTLAAPEITMDNLENLGLTALLGKGESNFAGSPNNRRHNINVGAAKLNGLLIKPGEEFSFAQNIGEIDEANGYLPELVIKSNKTVSEYGGGVCQISTTLFRAAVNSGLKISERFAHAIPLRYYNPPGFDATVYPPKPDLKFINDTPNNILLQSKIAGAKLYFEIYGAQDGRQIKIKGPTITYKGTDGSLKTILTQEIWRDGKIERSDVFRSSYKSPDLYPIVSPSPTPTP